MGQGGKLILVNGTKYDWDKTIQESYQMNSWDFPKKILAGQTATIYIEWEEGFFVAESDDGGKAAYTISGSSQSFEVQAIADSDSNYNLQVDLTNISMVEGSEGNIIPLGWIHDGYMPFVLSGEAGQFCSSNIPTNWMQKNLNVLGSRSIRQLCVLGSHDAGMSVITSGTPFGVECNTLTQSVNIFQQLAYGTRYFDVRPAIGNGGKFLTGHYNHIKEKTWQGANGESIESIIQGVNAYTEKYRELVILNLSHSLNTELGNNSYREFTLEEWNKLFALLTSADKGIKNLFITANPKDTDLTTLSLNTFIANKAAVIVIVRDKLNTNGVETEVNLGEYAQKGIYGEKNFPLYDDYSKTNDLDKMVGDQINKMKLQRLSPNSEPFLLSWTLTQSETQATACNKFISTPASAAIGGVAGGAAAVAAGFIFPPLGIGLLAGAAIGLSLGAGAVLTDGLNETNSIKDLANIANPRLFDKLLPQCNSNCYPNILYVDNIQSRYFTAMAMAVNSTCSVGTDSLKTYQVLKVNNQLVSANGAFILLMQQDGNLCVYKLNNGKQTFVWASMKYNFNNARLAMQEDGNLVVFDDTNKIQWTSNTSAAKPVKLVLENDGKLRLYNTSGAVVSTIN